MDRYTLWEVWSKGVYDYFPINEGDVVVDVGAHVGSFSVRAAMQGATVFALEPSEANYAQLLRHIELNGMADSITPLNLAMGAEEGCACLSGSFSNALSTMGRLVPGECANPVQTIGLKSFGHIDLLKIDCEGCEWMLTPDALAGVQKIVMEVHGSPKPMVERLNAWGFNCVQKGGGLLGLVSRTSYIFAWLQWGHGFSTVDNPPHDNNVRGGY